MTQAYALNINPRLSEPQAGAAAAAYTAAKASPPPCVSLPGLFHIRGGETLVLRMYDVRGQNLWRCGIGRIDMTDGHGARRGQRWTTTLYL